MSDLKQAAQQALEALEAIDEDPGATHSFPALSQGAIDALRAALEAQEEPRREWQWLTNEEIDEGRVHLPTEDLCGWSFRQGVIFAEQALKEKNHE